MAVRFLSLAGLLALFALSLPLFTPLVAEEARGPDVIVTPEGEALVARQRLLVIGIDKYQDYKPLRCAVSDAKAVVQALTKRYIFHEVTELYDDQATQEAILNVLDRLVDDVAKDDSVLIYYAGHGQLDERTKTGFWIPVDARKGKKASWVANDLIKRYVSSLQKARHVLLISDSCFAGDFLQQARLDEETAIDHPYYRQVYAKPSRMALVSGGLQPVGDGAAGGHSPFATFVLRTLNENTKPYLTPRTLFSSIREGVSLSSSKEQVPDLDYLEGTGSQRGEYVFFLKLEHVKGTAAVVSEKAPEPAGGTGEPAVSTRPTKPTVRLTGELVLTSKPAGADVLLDYETQSRGKTPMNLSIKLTQEESRNLEVAFSLKGYKLETVELTVARGDRLEVETVELEEPKAMDWLENGFEVPEGDRDPHGNAARRGTDRDRGWPLEIRHKATGMLFVLIPAGEFMMGSPENEKDRNSDEGPVHKVKFARPFYIGKYEVTRGQFAQFAKDAGYQTDAEKEGWARAGESWEKVDGASWQKPGFDQTDDHPVAEVSLNDAKAFCEWMSRDGAVEAGLPTEAQWEYACRAGTQTAYHWGDAPDEGKGCCNALDRSAKKQLNRTLIFDWDDGYVFTAPVGRFKPNGFGLHDMHGNVSEWCEDAHRETYQGAPEDGSIPVDPATDALRIRRGGSWGVMPVNVRAAARLRDTRESRDHNTGFRIVLVWWQKTMPLKG